MSRHLDTNIVIALLNGDAQVSQCWQDVAPEIAISTVVLGELLFGMRNSQRATANLTKLRNLMREMPTVPFDEGCAEHYSDIRLELKRKGRLCGDMDMMIAATAIAHDATLVTGNTRHFAEIDGLRLEDWLTDND